MDSKSSFVREESLYFGFPIDEKAVAEIERLHAGHDDRLRVQSKALARTIIGLLDASMTEFFLKPLAMVGPDQAGERIVSMGVKTVKRVVGVLVSSLVHRLSQEELDALVQDLGVKVYQREASEHWLAAPFSCDMDHRLNHVIHELDTGVASDEIRTEFRDILLQISYASIDVFFREPLKLLELSYLSGKATKTAVESTEKAVKKVISKVVMMMNLQQLTLLAHYIGRLRFCGEGLRTLV